MAVIVKKPIKDDNLISVDEPKILHIKDVKFSFTPVFLRYVGKDKNYKVTHISEKFSPLNSGDIICVSQNSANKLTKLFNTFEKVKV